MYFGGVAGAIHAIVPVSEIVVPGGVTAPTVASATDTVRRMREEGVGPVVLEGEAVDEEGTTA